VSLKTRQPPFGPTHLEDKILLEVLSIDARKLEQLCETLGARTSAAGVRRLIELFSIGRVSHSSLIQIYDEINSRLKDELALAQVFVVEQEKVQYIAPSKPLFGPAMESNFPSAMFEIDEAAKCLAFGRSTACVFHLMRVMEIAILAIARCLQIPDPVKPSQRNWGEMLKRIRTGIDTRWPTTADRMSGDGALFESLQASLDAVRNPWRNSTMHVENKYTEEEAEHIFAAVRGFARQLAARCDEKGLPLA
jgi:hypothetical protein